MPTSLRCLVTGSSGYIGGRLVPELLAAGHQVRCMARDPGKLGDQVEGVPAQRPAGGELLALAQRRARFRHGGGVGQGHVALTESW